MLWNIWSEQIEAKKNFDRSSTLLLVPEKWNSQGIMLLEVVLVFARLSTTHAWPITLYGCICSRNPIVILVIESHVILCLFINIDWYISYGIYSGSCMKRIRDIIILFYAFLEFLYSVIYSLLCVDINIQRTLAFCLVSDFRIFLNTYSIILGNFQLVNLKFWIFYMADKYVLWFAWRPKSSNFSTL